MPIKIIKKFIDHNDSELQCYENADGRLYIGIDVDPHCMEGGCIALDLEDAKELISELQEIVSEMSSSAKKS